MRSERKPTALYLGALFLAVTAGAVVYAVAGLARPSASAARPAWTVGTRQGLSVEWNATSEVAVDGSALEGRIDLEVDLDLRAVEARSGGTLLEAAITRVGRHEVAVLGQQILGDDAAAQTVVGPRAWAEVRDDGSLARIWFEPSAPPVFQHLVQQLLQLGQVTVPAGAGAGWEASEPGPSGRARVRYRRSGATLERERIAYEQLTATPAPAGARQALSAHASIVLDASGLRSLTDEETLTVTAGAKTLFHNRSRIRFQRRDAGLFPARPVALAGLPSRAAGEVAVGEDAVTQRLRSRADGLTLVELEAGLDRVSLGANPADGWFGRAVSLLQLDPALCEQLVEKFGDPAFGDRGRVLIFDLLASAGHAEAQAAMRQALASAEAQHDGLPVALVQRFSLVRAPDAKSAAFVLALHAQAHDADARVGAAYAAGAIAGRPGVDAATAERISRTLRDELAQARTTTDRRELLSALGNAGRAENVDAIAALGRDQDATVRERAAWALRKTATPEARGALLTLAGDEDPRVANAAIGALGHQPIDGADLGRLERAVEGARAVASDAALVGFLAAHLDGGAPVERMLRAIAARSAEEDPRLQARALQLLQQLHG